MKSSFVLAVLACWALNIPSIANAQISFDIHLGRPGPRYVWVDGYWNDGPRRSWHQAHWEDPPYEHARWHEGRWYHPEERWERREEPRREWHDNGRRHEGRPEGGHDHGNGRGRGHGHGRD